jgi:HEAT repeat protein
LKNQTDISKETKKGRRPGLLIGLAAVAGVGALALVLIFVLKSKNAASDSSGPSESATATAPGTASTNLVSPVPGAAGQAPLDAQGLGVLIQQLNDSSLAMSERQKAVYLLIRNGSPEALAALKAAAGGPSPEIRGAIAGGLRGCPSPACTSILLSLLHDSEDSVAMAAVGSLARQGSPEAATALGQLLNDPQESSSVRCDAALGLGGIDQFGVVAMLTQAAQQTDDQDVAAAALKALGGRNFADTQAFFENFMKSPDASPELRLAAVEALGGAEGDPTAFLTSLLTDPDSQIRAEAAWALSATSATGNAGPQLLALLQSETDEDVRLRLYQALRNQQSYDVSAALAIVEKESDPSARIAGLDLLAKALHDTPTPALQSFFDQTAIPELKNDALNAQVFDDKQAAILALTRAHSPGAMQALQELAGLLAEAAPPPPQTAPPPKPRRPPGNAP